MKIHLFILLLIPVTISLLSCNKRFKNSNATSSNGKLPPPETALPSDEEDRLYRSKGVGNLLIEKKEAEIYINNLDRRLRWLNPKISNSVWMDTAVFRVIYESITKNKSISGIRVHFIQYDDDMTDEVPGRKYERQTSLVMVPTSYINEVPEGSSHQKDNWEAWDYLRVPYNKWIEKKGFGEAKQANSKNLSKTFAKSVGLNHGTLCPDSCFSGN